MKNLYLLNSSNNLSAKIKLILFFLSIVFAGETMAQTKLIVTGSSAKSCKDDGTATLNVSGGTAPYSAYWVQYAQTPSGGKKDTVAQGLSVSGLKPGYYMVYISDNSLPTKLTTVYTTMIQASFFIRPKITPANCSNADGKIRVDVTDTAANAKGPYSYEWSNGINHLNVNSLADSIINIPSGNYSIKVTNGNGCYVKSGAGVAGSTNAEGLFVSSNSSITGTTSATASNCFDGTAKITPANGTGPYFFLWSTSPAQFTQTATGLSPGYINVIVSDSKGCSKTFYVNVPAGPNYLQATSIITPESCNQSNGAINMTITGGTKPYSYLWNNGASSEDLSGLSAGYYQVTITDALGCKLKAYKQIKNVSPLKVSISATSPGCNLSNGQLIANVSGGTPPYAFSWNQGSVTTSTFPNAPKGFYYVTVTDNNGCKGYEHYNLLEPASCKAMITGRIFNDINGNCIADPGEEGLPNIIVNAAPGNHYATSNNQGYYSIPVDAGIYDIKAFTPKFWKQQCPSNPNTINVNAGTSGTSYSGNNFFLVPDSLFNDLVVQVSSGPARPGFSMTWNISVRNAGTTTLSPALFFQHDPNITFTSSTPAPSGYSLPTKTLTWNVSSILPNSTQYFYVQTKIPTTAKIGDSLRSNAKVTFTGSDVTPKNDSSYYARIITGSYDPNDKQVSPAGFGPDGYVTKYDSTFLYRIRFQNSGTDTAFTIIVRDTLDPDLDVSSFKFRSASHPVNYSITGNGILEFVFNNILLPDSNVNEPGSHGNIFYEINRKNNIPLESKIENRASIYFDFNLPIHTNKTINTLFDASLGMEPLSISNAEIMPNPTNGNSILSFNLQTSQTTTLAIYDLSGKLIYKKDLGMISSGDHRLNLQRGMVQNLPGFYFVMLENGKENIPVKWVINE